MIHLQINDLFQHFPGICNILNENFTMFMQPVNNFMKFKILDKFIFSLSSFF